MKSILLSFAWKGFLRRKNHFMAAMIGFALAVIVFVLVLSILEENRKSVAGILTQTGTHFIAYKPVCCAPPFFDAESDEGFIANGAPSQPFSRDLLPEISGLKSVKDASPFLLFRIVENHTGMLIGGFDPINRIAVAGTSCSAGDLVCGRFLNPEDTSAVILEQSIAQHQNLSIGDTLRIKGKSFYIVGIVNPGIRPAKADIYMSIRGAEQLLTRSTFMPVSNLMNIILVESAGAYRHSQAMSDVKEKIGRTGLISTYGCYKPASAAMRIESDALKLLSIIIFCFANLLALKTQIASVNERKRDIGILSAIGWSARSISALIFWEAMISVILGAVLGTVLVIILAFLLPGLDSRIALPFILIAVGLTLSSGLIASLFPARFAVRKLPSENLQIL